jgi:hypothetical protein
MRQRTQAINALRADMAELGIVAAQGRGGIKDLLKIIASEQDARLPADARPAMSSRFHFLGRQFVTHAIPTTATRWQPSFPPWRG